MAAIVPWVPVCYNSLVSGARSVWLGLVAWRASAGLSSAQELLPPEWLRVLAGEWRFLLLESPAGLPAPSRRQVRPMLLAWLEWPQACFEGLELELTLQQELAR